MAISRPFITGGGGQLASDLEELLQPRVQAPSEAELDITDERAVDAALKTARPGVVFNCAAFHNVDLCEREEAKAFEVNAIAVKRLAERCAERGALLVHFSTNYVFPGDREEPYGEDDRPEPRSAYAISKLAGEHAALAYAQDALVIRTAGLYGLHGSEQKGGNFLQRVLARARAGEPIQMVADQRLNPTFTADLAPAVLAAVERGCRGLLHLTSSGACSWYELTVAAMELAGLDARVQPVETTPRPGVADRPLNGVLARPAADATGLEPLRGWREGLADYLERAGVTAISTGTP